MEEELKARLMEWRRWRAQRDLPAGPHSDFGPTLLVADSVLERIVRSACASEIVVASDIFRETGCRRADSYSGEIFAIVAQVCSPRALAARRLALPSLPQHGVALQQPDVHADKRRCARCVACHQHGHDGESRRPALPNQTLTFPCREQPPLSLQGGREAGRTCVGRTQQTRASCPTLRTVAARL